MVDVNINNTVDYLHEVCKQQDLEFFCYVGKSNEAPDVMSVYTSSKRGMINRMCACAKEDAGVVDFFKKLYQNLKPSKTLK